MRVAWDEGRPQRGHTPLSVGRDLRQHPDWQHPDRHTDILRGCRNTIIRLPQCDSPTNPTLYGCRMVAEPAEATWQTQHAKTQKKDGPQK